MKESILVYVCLLTTVFVLGQSSNFQRSSTGDAISGFQNFGSNTGTWVKNSANSPAKVRGSVYLFDNWSSQGTITAVDGKQFHIKGMNYDASVDQMVVKISPDSIYAFNGGTVKEVSINNKNFKRYLDPDFGRNSYYEVIISTSEFELLKRNVAILHPGALNPLTHQKQVPDTYVVEEKYFCKRKGDLEEFKVTKRNVVALFQDHVVEVKDFIKDNHLNIKEDNDLMKTVMYGSSL